MPLSSQVEEHQRVVRALSALLQTENRGLLAAEALSKRLSGYLKPGEEMPDVALLFALLSREIEDTQQKLEQSDQAYALEEADDPAVKDAHEAATEALYTEVVQTRSEVEAVYGDSGIRALGMSGDTTRVAARLERHARTIAERLKDARVSLGAPKSARLNLERNAVAGGLLSLCDALLLTVQRVAQEKAELQQKQDERNRALEHWSERVPSDCAMARGILLAAGDKEGAARAVSTSRRAAPVVAEPESPPQKDPGV